jgi:hypothetical protein
MSNQPQRKEARLVKPGKGSGSGVLDLSDAPFSSMKYFDRKELMPVQMASRDERMV